MPDFGGSDLEAFRAEARGWLEANFPKDLADDPLAQVAKMQGLPESPPARAWRKAMGEKGWGVPTWPAAYGGGGLSAAEGPLAAFDSAAERAMVWRRAWKFILFSVIRRRRSASSSAP